MARVAVVGPGAIGAPVAAAVEETGRHELVVCGRTPVAGLSIERDGESPVEVRAPVVTEPVATGAAADWVLLAVKAHQTESAAPWLRALCSPSTTVVALQNGLGHEERVAPLAGGAHVIPAAVWFSGEVVAPGRVRVRGRERVVVPDDSAGRAFAALLPGTRLHVELTDDFLTESWRKLILNAVAGLEVLAGRRSQMFARADVRALATRLAAECIAVGRAEGARLDDEPDEIAALFAASPPDMGTSILFDRVAGRPLEWRERNGVICELGARHGIATPVSDVIVPLLAAASGELVGPRSSEKLAADD